MKYENCDYCGSISDNGDCCGKCYDAMFSDGD